MEITQNIDVPLVACKDSVAFRNELENSIKNYEAILGNYCKSRGLRLCRRPFAISMACSVLSCALWMDLSPATGVGFIGEGMRKFLFPSTVSIRGKVETLGSSARTVMAHALANNSHYP